MDGEGDDVLLFNELLGTAKGADHGSGKWAGATDKEVSTKLNNPPL